MPEPSGCSILYDPRREDSTVALQRCLELTAFLHDALWQEKPPEGHGAYPLYFSPEGASGFVWWLSRLQATLHHLYEHSILSHQSDILNALVTYLVDHPKQVENLRTILVDATEQRFTQWNRVREIITPPAAES